MVATASAVLTRSSSKLAGRGGTETQSLTYPPQKSPGVLNQAIVVAKLSLHHVQSKQPSAVWYEEITLNTRVHLYVKLRHTLHFVIYHYIVSFLLYVLLHLSFLWLIYERLHIYMYIYRKTVLIFQIWQPDMCSCGRSMCTTVYLRPYVVSSHLHKQY